MGWNAQSLRPATLRLFPSCDLLLPAPSGFAEIRKNRLWILAQVPQKDPWSGCLNHPAGEAPFPCNGWNPCTAGNRSRTSSHSGVGFLDGWGGQMTNMETFPQPFWPKVWLVSLPWWHAALQLRHPLMETHWRVAALFAEILRKVLVLLPGLPTKQRDTTLEGSADLPHESHIVWRQKSFQIFQPVRNTLPAVFPHLPRS